MEWTKIKVKHFLLTDFSLTEHGALSRLLCLTAHLERVPTPREVAVQVAQPTYEALVSRLQTHSTTLTGVLAKVLEDVDGIQHKKEVSKGTSKRYREKKVIKNGECDTSHDTTEKRREEKRRRDKKDKTFTPPSIDEVREYCNGRHNNISSAGFINWYKSNGWMVGKNKMKDWKATIRTWELRDMPKTDPKKQYRKVYS